MKLKRTETQYEYDRRRHNRNVRMDKKMRAWKRCLKTAMPRPKPGVRPLSVLHPEHPARLYGWNDERTKLRDKTRWA